MEAEATRRSGVYEPLGEHLRGCVGRNVTLGFAELADLVGRPLPMSAWGRDWWTNTRHHSHARAWLDAGWRVDAFDRRRGGRVTFTRAEGSTI